MASSSQVRDGIARPRPGGVAAPVVVLVVQLVAGLILGLVGCRAAPVRESGKVTPSDVPIGSFSQMQVSNAFNVTVTRGDQPKLTLRVDDNLRDRVDAGVTDGRLHIGLKSGTTITNGSLGADVTAPNLSEIEVSGASKVRLSGQLTAQTLTLKSSGAGRVEGPVRAGGVRVDLSGASHMGLSGTADRLTLRESGAGNVDARQLQARDGDVTLSGASSATIWVTGTVAAQLSGASRLRYRGSPRFSRQSVTGGSDISPA